MSDRPNRLEAGPLERTARFLARHTSRRAFLGRLGALLVGSAAFPVLPVDRRRKGTVEAGSFAALAQTHDETQCNYWRYCALGGSLCSCCGGTASSCPAGTIAPATGWVGTCLNPDDQQQYLVMYRDCCGKEHCGRCGCMSADHEFPVYRTQSTDEFVWCFGSDQMAYHCTLASLIGKA